MLQGRQTELHRQKAEGVFKCEGEIVEKYWRKLAGRLFKVFANWHVLKLGSYS